MAFQSNAFQNDAFQTTIIHISEIETIVMAMKVRTIFSLAKGDNIGRNTTASGMESSETISRLIAGERKVSV